MRCRGGLGYHKRSNEVRDWFRCLRREEAEGRRQPEMGLPLVKKTAEVVLRPGRSGGPSLGVLALSVALFPSGRRLSGSPRRGCNLDPILLLYLSDWPTTDCLREVVWLAMLSTQPHSLADGEAAASLCRVDKAWTVGGGTCEGSDTSANWLLRAVTDG